MKREKLDKLLNDADIEDIIAADFEKDRYQLHIIDHTDKLIYAAGETDFVFGGFYIMRKSSLTKAKSVLNKTNKSRIILREIGFVDKLDIPVINLSSWENIFKALKKMKCLVCISNFEPGTKHFFYLGRVTKVKKHSVRIAYVTADGDWYFNEKIPYNEITKIQFKDSYSVEWENYLRRHRIYDEVIYP